MDFIGCHMQTAFLGKRFRFPAKAEEFLRKGLTPTNTNSRREAKDIF